MVIIKLRQAAASPHLNTMYAVND